ncbi:hypothetical protein [Pseudomonas putida]|nr:hypothetical protein [Pseudomonas putida]
MTDYHMVIGLSFISTAFVEVPEAVNAPALLRTGLGQYSLD